MLAEKKLYDLTHHQKGMWYTEKVYPNTALGVVAGTFRELGHVDYDILKRAINAFVRDNDAMRCRIVEDNGEVFQYFADYEPFEIELKDFSNKDINEFYNWEREQTVIPMELTDVPLFSFIMVKISDNDGGYYIKMHHLISDAWSITLLGNSIAKKYLEILNGEDKISKAPSYTEYITSAKEYEKSERYKKDFEFWMSKYDSAPEITTLKPKRSKELSRKANRKTFVLPEKLCQKMYEYSKKNGVSIFSMYMSAISMYMYRYTGKEKLNMGTMILNRGNKKEKDTVGMFVATVPVVLDINGNENFEGFSKKVTSEMFSVMRHQHYPFGTLQEELRKKYNFDDVLYDIILSYQNAKLLDKVNNINYKTRWHFCGYQSNSLTIHINDRDNEGKLIIDYDYLDKLFYDREIEFIHDNIIKLLWHAIDNPERKIAKIEMVSEKEKNKLLYEFNNLGSEYPKECKIFDLMTEIVHTSPDNIAVEYENNTYTYKRLYEDVKIVSSYLINLGVKGTNIGVLMHHSYETIVAILSIMRAGATYIPLDVKHPRDRINQVIKLAEINTFFTQKEYADNLSTVKNLLYVEEILSSNVIFAEPPTIDSENIVYIIFTSGSTGTPKGVMVKHKGLVNYIYWAAKVYNFPNEINTYPLYSSLAFDLTVTSIFTPLISGGKIIIYRENDKESAIIRIVRENKCNILKLTPAHLSLLKDLDNTDSRIKRLIVGGEALKSNLCKDVTKSFNNAIEIFNEYGPTETVVGCMIYKYDIETDNGSTIVPIGKPADNVRLYVFDNNLNLCPIGMIGELYIGGEGVAAGYINNIEETKKRFIKNPYNENEIIYKTGDLVKWMSKGDMDYYGRSDFQIKIRGFRVEPEEIEKQIMLLEDVKDVIVIYNEDSEEKKYLCAYILANKKIDLQKIKNELLKKLPHYMVPSVFIEIDSIPVTPNGKVDKNKLPKPYIDGIFDNKSYKEPKSREEIVLSNAIKEILGTDKVSIDANLFEIGMDSLSIIRLQSSIFKYGWILNTQDFYNNPSIEELSAKILSNLQAKEIEEKITDIPNIIRPSINLKNGKKIDMKNVLITGCTGFLGVHILDYILRNTNANVYCLIRAQDAKKAENRLQEVLEFYFPGNYKIDERNRMKVVCGDISLENMGVMEGWNDIATQVDTVFHCAGTVKHYGNYEEFKRSNVIGTKNIIDFCKKYNKRLNYISTLSVSGYHLTNIDKTVKKLIFDEKSFYIGQKYEENVYVRSKFEAEKLMYEAIQEGLCAGVFRIGNLSWRKSDGKYQKNKEDNAFYGRIKAIYKSKMFPQSLLNTEIELTPIDQCAEAIVKLSLEFNNVSNTYHLYNQNTITIKHLLDIFKTKGFTIKPCSQEEFSEEIAQNKELVNMFANDTNKNNFIYYGSGLRYSNAETNKFLKRVQFKWDKIDEEYIIKFLESMVME